MADFRSGHTSLTRDLALIEETCEAIADSAPDLELRQKIEAVIKQKR
jgi:hypothetical protein